MVQLTSKHAVVTPEYEHTLFRILRDLKSILLKSKVNVLEY